MKPVRLTHQLMIFLFITLFLLPIIGFSQSSAFLKSQTSDYIQGSIIIKVKDGIGPFDKQDKNIHFDISSLDKMIVEYNINKLEKRFKHKPISKNSGLPDLSRIYKIDFPKTLDVRDVAMSFANDPNIEYANVIPVYKLADIPDDPDYFIQQHLPQIMAAEAWDIHKGEDGDEVVVAIVDTGADWLHPDLTDNCWQNLGEDADGDGVTLEFNNGVWERDPDDLNNIDDDGNGYVDDVIGWDFHEAITIDDGSNPDPIWGQGPYEHGSHCAGIAAGVTNNDIGISSVSWNVKYMPVQTDDGNNTVLYGIDGIIYAAENGADVISNSWYHGYGYSPFEYDAIQYAIGLGSIICFAASNDNSSDVAYPGGYMGVISVAAVNPDDTRASFSNYGIPIDISAPGVSILSTTTNNGYASWNGTSMATPMVAGLFGLLKSYQPLWTNDQLIEQIIGTADNIDALNSDYENALGSGRINAYHALVDENVIVPQELKLELLSLSFEDEDGDNIIEAGETVSVSFSMRNYSQMVNAENTTFEISSYDTDIIMNSSSIIVDVAADAEFEVANAFEFTVSENTTTHISDFILEVSSDLPITYGSEFELSLLVAPSGIFVWEGEANSYDYSGTFIKNYLDEQGYEAMYSNSFPTDLSGFDAVFLSFGNIGETAEGGTLLNYNHSLTIQKYLENGGMVYCEGAPFFFISEYNDFPNDEEFRSLFGVESGIGNFSDNPISKLSGIEGSIHQGMTFNSSNQIHNWYIDKIIPKESANISFSEEAYGNVSVYNEGDYDQKTFYFSYSMAELEDTDPHSSRYNMLAKIMDFFGYNNGDLIANFQTDKTEGEPNLIIQFSDWSVAEESEITSWEWDFNEDGIIDSYDQNPEWTFTEGGIFDVSLTVSADGNFNTITKKDFIKVRSGILIYEGKNNLNGYSGTFIRNYLESQWYDELGYTNNLPQNLSGYDAVFLSFGNTGSRGTSLSDEMVQRIYTYAIGGGNIYIEGGDAMGAFGSSEWAFGLMGVDDGEKKEVAEMIGQEEALTHDMQFNGSSQLSNRKIDKYTVNTAMPGAFGAFHESEYGITAVQFDGSQINGQKTFCMSYALADLDDGAGLNTRNELLSRILNFFNVSVDVEELVDESINNLKVFPNPATDNLSLAFNLDARSQVSFEVYELSGRKVDQISKAFDQGTHRIQLDIDAYSSGVHYIKMQAGNKIETIKWVKVD